MNTRAFVLPVIALACLAGSSGCAHHRSFVSRLLHGDRETPAERVADSASSAKAPAEIDEAQGSDPEATYEIEEINSMVSEAGSEPGDEGDIAVDAVDAVDFAGVTDAAEPAVAAADKNVPLALNGVLMPAYDGPAKPGFAETERERENSALYAVSDAEEKAANRESVNLLRPAPGTLKLTGGSGFVYMRSDYKPRPVDPEWQRMILTLRPFSNASSAN